VIPSTVRSLAEPYDFSVNPVKELPMRSSDKTRFVVFLVFFVGLIVFAILYTPTNAVSRPAGGRHQKNFRAGIAESSRSAQRTPRKNESETGGVDHHQREQKR